MHNVFYTNAKFCLQSTIIKSMDRICESLELDSISTRYYSSKKNKKVLIYCTIFRWFSQKVYFIFPDIYVALNPWEWKIFMSLNLLFLCVLQSDKSNIVWSCFIGFLLSRLFMKSLFHFYFAAHKDFLGKLNNGNLELNWFKFY